jgi:hypothetical protein
MQEAPGRAHDHPLFARRKHHAGADGPACQSAGPPLLFRDLFRKADQLLAPCMAVPPVATS